MRSTPKPTSHDKNSYARTHFNALFWELTRINVGKALRSFSSSWECHTLCHTTWGKLSQRNLSLTFKHETWNKLKHINFENFPVWKSAFFLCFSRLEQLQREESRQKYNYKSSFLNPGIKSCLILASKAVEQWNDAFPFTWMIISISVSLGWPNGDRPNWRKN